MAWWKKAIGAGTATAESSGAEINKRAAELQMLAGRGVTTSAAVTAIATALGNEVAALAMRNPNLPMDEMLDIACQSVRNMARYTVSPSPDAPKNVGDLTEPEFAQLTMRIIYTATPEATITDAMTATAKALGIMIAMTARRGSAGFDETLRWGQNAVIGFAREAREAFARDAALDN